MTDLKQLFIFVTNLRLSLTSTVPKSSHECSSSVQCPLIATALRFTLNVCARQDF